MAGNGEAAQLPMIGVTWDEETQQAAVQFNSKEFRSWQFVISVLGMAQEAAEYQLKLQQMQAMGQAMQEQQQAASLARRLREGR